MKYEFFKDHKIEKDPKHPFLVHVIIDNESDFYFEPMVYTQLKGFEERHKDKMDLIIGEIINRVKRNKHVIFVGDFETNTFEKDGYVILEITDITDPLQIFVEDKSRGSDYGD